MKNLFTKLVCVTLLCNLSAQMSASTDFELNEAPSVVCPTVADVNFPPTVELAIAGIDINSASATMTPELLVNDYGVAADDAYVTWDDPDNCDNLQETWEDQVFDLSNGSFKILRSWTVLDWDLNETTSGVQIIKNILTSSSYCESFVETYVTPWACEYILNSADLLAPGIAYDNLVMDPPQGTVLGLGITAVNISGTVAGEDFSCITSVDVLDDAPPVAIAIQNLSISLIGPDCNAVLYPSQIDNGSHDGACGTVTLSISPDFITSDMAATDVNVILTVTYESGNINQTWTTATVSACSGTGGNSLACIGFTVVGPLQDDGIQLSPEDFLADSSTASDDLSLEITDEDGNVIPGAYIPALSYGTFIYTITDNATGNSCWGTLSIPLPFLPCEFLTCNDQVHLTLEANGTVTFGPEDLSPGLGNCTNLEVTITDLDNNIILTSPQPTMNEAGSYYYTISNADGNSCWGNLTIGDFTPCPSLLVCNAQLNVSMSSVNGGAQTATITSNMLLEGNSTGCDLDSYLIELNDTGVVGYFYSGIGSVVVDQPSIYTYTVTDPATGNSCWGTAYIEQVENCYTLADVNFPDDLDFALSGINASNLYATFTPENLVSNLGVTYEDANASWDLIPNCGNLASTYDDAVIDLGDGSFKILRTWTILDWLTAEISTHVQIIRNIVFPGIICDFLPNSATLGDCDSGHTNSDDVEWPDDLLTIADYRITPNELALYSAADPADTKPVFVNNASQYTVEYTDILNEFQIQQLTVGRVWSVYTGGVVVANYTQTLVIDISDLNSLVAVNTMFERPIPDVELNNDVLTDNSGVAYLDDDGDINLNRIDDPTNGVTIRDLIFVQQYILGLRDLTDHQLMAADFSSDDQITAMDLVEIRKNILEVSPGPFSDWRFVDVTETTLGSTLRPKGNFIGIKPGDVDDDAFLGDPIMREEGIMLLSDVLINNGENYEATLEYDGEELSLGVEIHLYYDENLIEVTELYVDNPDMAIDYNLDEPGEIHVTMIQNGNSGFVFADENLINIKFAATSNGLLSQAIKFVSPRNSFLLGLDYELITLSIEMGEVIGTGVETTAIHSEMFEVYPNPARDIVNFDFIDETPSDFTIQLFDTNGQLISQHKNQTAINVNELSSGMYLYKLIDEDRAYSGLLSVIK